jgi:hypothetical protein
VGYPNGDIIRAGGEVSGTCTNTVQFYSQATMTWRSGPALLTIKCYNGVVVLKDGRILVFGGWGGSVLANAEICSSPITTGPTPAPNGATSSPTSNSIAPTMAPTSVGSCVYTTGNMNSARTNLNGVAQMLNNGQVLICGGSTTTGGSGLTSCELYNPTTGLFTVTGSMSIGRKTVAVPEDSYVKLLDGRVFTVPMNTASTICEIYDPISGTWSQTAPLPASSGRLNIVLLNNGNVLMTRDSSTIVYLFNATSNTMQTVGSLPSAVTNNKLVKLQNGNILSVGGYANPPNSGTTNVYLYNVALGTWSTMAAFTGQRWGAEAVVLLNGNVLMCGGTENTNNCLVYYPTLNVWANSGQPTNAFVIGHQMILMTNGEVVASSTSGGSVFTQVYGLDGIWRVGPSMAVARYLHSVVALTSTQILVMGGNTGGGSVHNTAEICTVSLAPTPAR